MPIVCRLGGPLVFLLLFGSTHAQPTDSSDASGRPIAEGRSPLVVDDFESHSRGDFPEGWVFVTRDREVKSYADARSAGESVSVRAEDGNQFVRLIAKDDVVRYTKRNGTDFEWDVTQRPVVRWRWRAVELPDGASERGDNDVGAAVYVTFGTDWIGRPVSLKYTYSSALPVGTTVGFGSLQVIVVDSKVEGTVGTWQTVSRNVVRDYRRVFGEEPPAHPAGITIWSDSDTTHDMARADLDDIALHARPASPEE